MTSVFEPQWEESDAPQGFRASRDRVGARAGAERLGASLYELPPGQAPFPLHYHLGNEEMLIVLRGTPSLRTLAGERRLSEGEVVAFPVGEQGAHQVVNRTNEPVRVLIVSEMIAPEVVVRPESGKLSAFGRPPGGRGKGMHRVFFERDEVPFWEGEEPPEAG
jgi:uncharacterized cupin superfamily protein